MISETITDEEIKYCVRNGELYYDWHGNLGEFENAHLIPYGDGVSLMNKKSGDELVEVRVSTVKRVQSVRRVE